MPFAVRILASICLILTACLFATPYAAAQTVKISQFSGKPVPRFEALRYSAVHGRKGPSRDHEIVWRYERQDMPVLIIKETRGWTRIRDADGDEVWVQSRMLKDAPHVVLTQPGVLRRKPDESARGIAALQTGVVAELDHCMAGWCEIRTEKYDGWVRQPALWGVDIRTGGL